LALRGVELLLCQSSEVRAPSDSRTIQRRARALSLSLFRVSLFGHL
jgi:hypothetical protein